MTNFMLLCMLLGGGFADRYSSRRNQIKVQFAAVHESAYGTSRHFAAPQNLSPIGLTTDKRLALGPDGSAAIDPKQTSRTRWRRLIDLRYGFELATEGPEIRSDFTPLALQKRACRRGARNHEI